MKKPKGAKYRNLYVPKDRSTIWYARLVGGRRYRANTKRSPATLEGWKEAALYRDRYEELKGIGRARVDYGAIPTFAELVPRYLETPKFARLSANSQGDRRHHLAETGPILPWLAGRPVDEITADTLTDWWQEQTKARGWSMATALRYLSTISEVLKVGRRYLSGRALPTAEAREVIVEQTRTAKGRAESSGHVRPVESPDALEALLDAAREEGGELGAFVLTLLDAGVRRGEALALRWRNVAWGADEDDPRRHLVIEASLSGCQIEAGPTKSGRSRRVGLSRRLRAALGELFREQRPRSLDERVFASIERRTLRVTWPRIAGRADQPGVRLKDLRDSYASHLLTLGIPIQFVSRQLGHGGISVTQSHYARYLGSGGEDFLYVEPPRLGPGEIPADLLARLRDCSQSAHTGDVYALPRDLEKSEEPIETERLEG